MPRPAHTHTTTITAWVVACLIALFCTVVCDGLLWVFAPFALANLEPEGFERVVTQHLPGLKETILYNKGPYGLRSLSPVAPVKPKQVLRILCLGASTTDQSTQNTQDTWCGILETKLLKQYRPFHVPIQTMAFGRSGFRASDDAFWLKETFEQIKPDMVITLLGINDLAWNGGPTYHYRSLDALFAQKMHERKISQEREGGLTSGCKAYSQICRRMAYIKGNFQVKAKLKTGASVEWHSANLPHLRETYQQYPAVEDLRRNPDPIDEFRDALTWLVTFGTQRHVPLLVLGQPVLWKDGLAPEEWHSLWFPVYTPQGPVRPSGAWLHREMARYNAVQQALAVQFGTPYINLDDKIPKTLAYYFDDCHFTDRGSRAVAETIWPVVMQVIEEMLVPKSLTKGKPRERAHEVWIR